MPPGVIAIVGATATGKTTLSIELARALDGEIVNADSRQMYRGMDVGTAKPTSSEQESVPHHLIDVANPDEQLTLASFLDLVHAALTDVWSRGRQPILVGGTGQYVWALIEGWQVPRVPPNPSLRSELESIAARNGTEAVLRELRAIDPASAATIDPHNARRIIRAIEVTRATGRPFSAWREKIPPDFESTIIGLRLERAVLYARVDERVDAMIRAGLVEEVRRLNTAGYGCDLPALGSIGYRQICAHLRGELTLRVATEQIKTETHRLARMQHTWFRDDDQRIHWLDASGGGLSARALAILRDGLPGGPDAAVS